MRLHPPGMPRTLPTFPNLAGKSRNKRQAPGSWDNLLSDISRALAAAAFMEWTAIDRLAQPRADLVNGCRPRHDVSS